MNHGAMPAHLAGHQRRRRRVFILKFGRPARLARVFELVVGIVRRSDEDDVVSRYEGHSWCDSTERSMNYDIMTSRYLRL